MHIRNIYIQALIRITVTHGRVSQGNVVIITTCYNRVEYRYIKFFHRIDKHTNWIRYKQQIIYRPSDSTNTIILLCIIIIVVKWENRNSYILVYMRVTPKYNSAGFFFNSISVRSPRVNARLIKILKIIIRRTSVLNSYIEVPPPDILFVLFFLHYDTI